MRETTKKLFQQIPNKNNQLELLWMSQRAILRKAKFPQATTVSPNQAAIPNSTMDMVTTWWEMRKIEII